jgi:phenylpyruvate tautomerase PptA (4-oxalocrotonate tautomerase family)
VPMIDAYIPDGALSPDAEKEMLKSVTDMVVRHEIRRTVDIMEDEAAVEASIKRASSIAWLFVHRPEVYVAGTSADMPYYKFHIAAPESQIDDEFRAASVRDITAAVAKAEDGRWPHPEFRVWVFTSDVPDGSWGGLGTIIRLGDVLSFVLEQDVQDEGARRVADFQHDRAQQLIATADTAAPAAP